MMDCISELLKQRYLQICGYDSLIKNSEYVQSSHPIYLLYSIFWLRQGLDFNDPFSNQALLLSYAFIILYLI